MVVFCIEFMPYFFPVASVGSEKVNSEAIVCLPENEDCK